MKVAIIGGGLTGLTAAYRLAQKGHKVTVFEKNDSLGGLMGGFKIGDTYIEKTYHHIFKNDLYIVNLIKELGLEKKLNWYPELMAIYFDDRISPFVTPRDLLKMNGLGLVAKIRTGMTGLWLRKDKNWEKYKKITAVEWIKKWGGNEAYKIIWAPLLRGKFGQYTDKISMAWLWARIHTRGSGGLGYLSGGFQQIVDELAKRIKNNGGIIKLNSETTADKIFDDYDKIIVTAPIKGIDYLGAVCVVFTSKQNLSKYYWHNINDPKSPFLAFIQHTNLANKNLYGGKHIYYLGTYIPQNHRYFSVDDGVIVEEFFGYLQKIFPEFDRSNIRQRFIFKFKCAQHIVNTKYKVPSYKVNEKIYQANFAQIYPEDRGMNYAVREGEKIASIL